MIESASTPDTLVELATHPQCISIGTWNMDHWKRTVAQRAAGWEYLMSKSGADVMLLQESVIPSGISRTRRVHRELGGTRHWGSSVVAINEEFQIEEIDTVSSRYASNRFNMVGTFPGAVIVTRVKIPLIGPITVVSVYGLINVYAQTTMLRIIADLIPLFDSRDGQRVVLGGDFNITTATSPNTLELPRYEAILKAVESLGLVNLAETDAVRPLPPADCPCGQTNCRHLHTFGENPGSQLDWLYATPELARRCRQIRVERLAIPDLSDHAPIIAKFDIPPFQSDNTWDSASFVKEIALRHGHNIAQVAEELIAWALRKHNELNAQVQHVSLDRLPISTGPNPELWVQIDLRFPERLQYSFSINSDKKVIIQFQYMTAPFDTNESRERLWASLKQIPGVMLDKRLNGRPSISLESLANQENLEQFERIFSDFVDDTWRFHNKAKR